MRSARGSSTTTERTKARAGHLTTEHADLMTEHDDLEFLGGIIPTAGEQRPEQYTNEHVDEHCSPSAHEWTEEDYEPWSERVFE